MKSKRMVAKIPLFNWEIELCVCKYDELHDSDGIYSGEYGGYHIGNNKIWINTENVTSQSNMLATLVHECNHMAFDLVRGIASDCYPGDMIGEELVCYVSDCAFEQFAKELIDESK